MARPLPIALIYPAQKLRLLQAPIAYFIMFAAVISVFSAVAFLCGSHGGFANSLRGKGRKKAVVRLGGGEGSDNKGKTRTIEKMKSSLSSKALLMAKMISWRKVQDEGEAEDYGWGEEEEDDDDVVWKKVIMKGEKCRPLDFSGKILYDCDGNRLPD